MLYTKPYLSVPQQIELLKARGLIFEDESKANEYLRRIGYYRLSAYCYPFRESTLDRDGTRRTLDIFRTGTTFKDVTDLYAFDKALRLILLDSIERIEVSLRTEVALCLGRIDPWAHRLASNFSDGFQKSTDAGVSGHSEWLRKLDEKFRSSKRGVCCSLQSQIHKFRVAHLDSG
jgi:abortive infection bacteriophage resistance protein